MDDLEDLDEEEVWEKIRQQEREEKEKSSKKDPEQVGARRGREAVAREQHEVPRGAGVRAGCEGGRMPTLDSQAWIKWIRRAAIADGRVRLEA